MAGDKVNTYAQDDSDILALQLTTDKTFKGYHQLTLTEYDTTTVPAIAAGSAIECNGALYKFDTEEAISTTDPVTSAAVADGTVYVCIVPGATTATAAFTSTAPTWSDSKQGWYGTGGQANYRYISHKMTKATASYSGKMKFLHYDDFEVVNTITSSITTANITTASIDVNNSYYLDDDGIGIFISNAVDSTGDFYFKLKKTCSIIFRITSASTGGGTIAGVVTPVYYSSSSPVILSAGDPTMSFTFAKQTNNYLFHLSPCYFKVSISAFGNACSFRIYMSGISGENSYSSVTDILEEI